METIDQDVASSTMFLLLEILAVIAIIGTISSVLPAFLFFAVLIALTYWAIGYIYLASSRELKRSGESRFQVLTRSIEIRRARLGVSSLQPSAA